MEGLLKGMSLKDWLYILTLIVGFGVMIFRQAIFFGRMIERQDGQDTKITKVENEVQAIKDARYVTHHDHFTMCRKNADELKERMDKADAENERRQEETSRNVQEITRTIKEGEQRRQAGREEDNNRWSLVEKQLAVNTAVLESVKEQLQKLEARS